MAGRHERTFSKRPPPDPSEGREARNDWINAKHREWQLYWHDLFDADPKIIAALDLDRDEPLPVEVGSDYRLIFGLARVTPATRQKCFAPFPEGRAMYRRYENFLSSKPVPLPEADARSRVLEVMALIEAMGLRESVVSSSVRVVDRDTDEGFRVLSKTDDTAWLLEGIWRRKSRGALPAAAARLFLSEPLYAAAGNFNHVRDWVTAAMIGGRQDEFYTQLYELWWGGWQLGMEKEGSVLASRAV